MTWRLAAAVLVLGCGGGDERRLYAPCSSDEIDTMACIAGCPGGGIGCETETVFAGRCAEAGPTAWALAFQCNSCASVTSGGVECDGLRLAEFGTLCMAGARACTADLRRSMKCSDDGRFIVDERCDEAGTACGRAGDSIGCQ